MWKWGFWWSRQESNLHLRLRKPTYYPLYYETNTSMTKKKPHKATFLFVKFW
jgi:hypothetical protein